MDKKRSVASFFVLFVAFLISDACCKLLTDATNFSDLAERGISAVISVLIIFIFTTVFSKLWPEKAKESKTEDENK